MILRSLVSDEGTDATLQLLDELAIAVAVALPYLPHDLNCQENAVDRYCPNCRLRNAFEAVNLND